jgi:hypothetical protein
MMDREPDMGALATYHFGHLPVWISGNAYFNGATVSKHDAHHYEAGADKKVTVALERTEEGVCLKSELWSYLKGFTCGLISSETLGCAFEPEQRFENPDGSDIIFDRDYFGSHRGLSAIPGPFADPDRVSDVLWKI